VSFVFHTATNPNGELRGQIIRYAREGYTINMHGEQVVPSVTSPAYGSGVVSTDRFDENAHYVWNVGSLAATATGAHFHHNITGFNGPVIHDMTGIMLASGTEVSAEGYWYSTDAVPFLPANSLQFSKDSVYLDIENSMYPNGEIRGQVTSGYSSASTMITVPENNTGVSVSVMPNPAQNVITISTISKPIASVEVITVYGQSVYHNNESGSATTATLDLSGYAKGIYFIRINGEGYSVLQKVIKE
jgi:hypothetical protein